MDLYATLAPSLVTGLLCLSDRRRINMARSAVNSFCQQHYQSKELVIVNATDKQILSRGSLVPGLREYQVDPACYDHLVALRNKALDEARGDWVILWDDDDHSHAHRIAYQMAHRREGHCVLLTHQVRIDVRNDVICVIERPQGHASTILFPREIPEDGSGSACKVRFNPFGTRLADENVGLICEFFKKRVVILPNSGEWFPGAALHTAFWHGLCRTFSSKSQKKILSEL